MGKRKWNIILGTMILGFGLILTGCGEKQKKSTDTGDQNSEKKLTVAIQTSSFVTDYEDNFFTKYLEKKTGIDLTFYQMPADASEFRTKVSLMVTNGEEMPDVIICDNCLTPETILDYGSKGAFIPLNDYINDEKKSPNFNKIPKEDQDVILQAITNADGKIYSLPKYEPETWNLTPYRMYINGSWLKKLNLQPPETTEELYQVLKAFREQDPNGNGQNDEIGAYGFLNGGYGEASPWALMNSFVFYNGGGQNGGLSLDENGKVIAPFTTEEWKDGLRYMNQLYEEGLMPASVFTDDDTQFKATLNAETNVVGFVSSGSTSVWGDATKSINFQEMDIIKPLKGPKGVAYTPYSSYSPSNAFFITSACKDPDLAFLLGDTLLDNETGLVARYGEEGVDWSREESDMEGNSSVAVYSGMYDKLSLVTTSNLWVEQQNQTWRNVNPRYASLKQGTTVGNKLIPFDPDSKNDQLGLVNLENYYPAHPEEILPLLHYSEEEAAAVTQALTSIPDYIKQSTSEFVIGQRNIDSDWENYKKELDSMGLSEWIKNAQSAYERMKKQEAK